MLGSPLPETLEEALQHIFRFTDADLRSNRLGILSESQKQRMRDKHEDDVHLTRLALVFLAVIGLLGSGAAAIQEGIPLVQMWMGVGLSMVIFGGFAWLVLHYSRARMERTIAGAKAEWVRGEIFFTERYDGGKTPAHYLAIGKKEFSLSNNGYSAHRQTSYQLNQLVTRGQRATVYYAHPWEYVLSVELDANPDQPVVGFSTTS